MQIDLKRLVDIDQSEIIQLMNNKLVRRQMPLLTGEFGSIECDKFIKAKEQLWIDHGFGPWAFIIDSNFAGWGGLQPEGDDADLALVLHPKYWGTGKTLYKMIIDRAFNSMKLTSVTVLFPPSRTRINGLLRLGFKLEREIVIGSKKFNKYRLDRHVYNSKLGQ